MLLPSAASSSSFSAFQASSPSAAFIHYLHNTMASTSVIDDHLPVHADIHSFDSAAKAAARMWHLHSSSKPRDMTTEGQHVSSCISRSSSSSNYDRRVTRFQQEVSMMTTTDTSASRKMPVWDCGSDLYDTFELVAFANRLERSFMEDVGTITNSRRQAYCRRSLPRESHGIRLQTRSLPQGLLRQTSKERTEAASPSCARSLSKSKLNTKSDKKGTKTGSSIAVLAQRRASIKWSRVRKFMLGIKKVVVLPKQANNIVGCKKSTRVIQSSHSKVESLGDDVCVRSKQLSEKQKLKAGSNGGTKGDYKPSISSKKSNSETQRANSIKAYHASFAHSRSGFSMPPPAATNTKTRSADQEIDFLSQQYETTSPRRRFVGNSIVFMDGRIKGSNLEGTNVEERIRGADFEHLDHYKHFYHHHHHNHHHHYLHQSVRLSPDLRGKKPG